MKTKTDNKIFIGFMIEKPTIEKLKVARDKKDMSNTEFIEYLLRSFKSDYTLESMKKEKQIEKELLLLVMNVITEKFDKMEAQDPDQSTAKWPSYKGIRNTIRDEIKRIAVSKDIEF